MIDLTKFGVTEGPWGVGCGYLGTGAYEKYPSIEGVKHTVAQVVDVTPTKEGNELHARILASSYEILGALIEYALDTEESGSEVPAQNLAIIEKALGLPWPEIRKRLEE